MTQENSNSYNSTLMLIVISVIWGSSYLFMKKALLAFSPIEMASIRLSFTSFCFLPFIYLNYHKVKAKDWWYFLIVAAFGSGIPAYLYAFAQTHVSSSIAGILGALNPLFTLLVGAIFFGFSFQPDKTLGILLGLIGAVILVLSGPNGIEFSSTNMYYSCLVLAAILCYSISTNTIQKHLMDKSPLAISSGAFLILLVPNTLVAFRQLYPLEQNWTPLRSEQLIFILLLSFLGTFLANIMFYKLVQRSGAVVASTVSYIIPLVSMVLGLWDGETLSIYQFLGMIIILLGIYITRK